MTKVRIEPGVCGLTAQVEALSEDGMEVTITIESDCPGVTALAEELGPTLNAFEVCFKKPGENLLYDFASQNFPSHAGCPVVAGIVKCVEAECGLALKKDAGIFFLED